MSALRVGQLVRSLRFARRIARVIGFFSPPRKAAVSSVGFVDAADYWERRYARGGNSGDGSAGRLAEHKATIINGLIAEYGLESAVEFGCGDGGQLQLMRFPVYTGLDVSRTAIDICRRKFAGDATKQFLVHDSARPESLPENLIADAALSIDVIYHLVSDAVFDRYMTQLCDAAGRLLIVYSTNEDRIESSHIRHRVFTRWVEQRRPELILERVVESPWPGTGRQRTDASFFVYRRSHPAR